MHQFKTVIQGVMQSRNILRTTPKPQRRYVVSPLLETKAKHFQKTSFKYNSTIAPNETSSFKTWPVAMIESKGDYREEAHLEDLIGGPLYSYQKSLPRLPIPTIEETISTLLPTALTLAESKEEADKFKEACRLFPDQAANLHEKLLARKSEMENSSWLQLWWNTEGYLKVRDSIVVNVSYFFHFTDDGSLPPRTNEWSLGINRAATMLYSTAEFRKQICSGSFPQRTIGRKEPKTPLCSVAYKYMFNSCRIPRREQDSYRIYDPSRHKHCVVACKGSYFAVDFMDDNGEPLPLSIIENRLQRCVELANNMDANAPNIGWLTSSDRDSWADAREELLRVGGDDMNRALETLESGALMICLDDEEPISRKQCANIFWTGGLSSGHNRWFDKSIQIMCTKNGKAGLIGEHSMMDGMPMVDFADYVTRQTYDTVESKSRQSKSDCASIGGVRNIFSQCVDRMVYGDSKVESMVQKAKEDFTTLVSDQDYDVQSFQGYGSDYIKKAGYSPDAYVQVAIQLAIYRLLGKQAATYEATQMRPFLHGRTETTRTVSTASAAFVQRMGLRPQNDLNDQIARKEKLSLLREAVQSHVNYTGKAAKGNGVDRHLLGMSMFVDDLNDRPTLFSDPLYQRAKTWRVSTSHLTHPFFENWGFGEVVPDGVGVGYGVKRNCCIFNITARREYGWTERLSHLLEEALLEMQLLNDLDTKLQSKL